MTVGPLGHPPNPTTVRPGVDNGWGRDIDLERSLPRRLTVHIKDVDPLRWGG